VSDHLRRSFAPISGAAWKAIDEEASRTLRHFLAGRAVVDFDGPKGWQQSAVDLGRVDTVSANDGEPEVRLRRVQPLEEVRMQFRLDRDELDAVDRGAPDPDLSAVIAAATRLARAEDQTIFYRSPATGVYGIADASPYGALDISDDYNEYPRTVAQAIAQLQASGIGGPYAIALGPRCYTGVIESTEHGGYPVLEHLRSILGGPVVWAPSVDGAVVLSLRGGDYVLTVGQDFSVGYLAHTESDVTLYIEESFTFRVLEPGAGIALRYPD
jgi:uncharacterized linocin/CFP29 family protein